jgi:hypothetical protein
MFLEINGFKLMLEHPMQFWKFLKKKEECFKLKRLWEMENLIYNFKWINKALEQKERMPLESSCNIYRFISQLPISKTANHTSKNIYK